MFEYKWNYKLLNFKESNNPKCLLVCGGTGKTRKNHKADTIKNKGVKIFSEVTIP
jgi:hypothetical protein